MKTVAALSAASLSTSHKHAQAVDDSSSGVVYAKLHAPRQRSMRICQDDDSAVPLHIASYENGPRTRAWPVPISVHGQQLTELCGATSLVGGHHARRLGCWRWWRACNLVCSGVQLGVQWCAGRERGVVDAAHLSTSYIRTPNGPADQRRALRLCFIVA